MARLAILSLATPRSTRHPLVRTEMGTFEWDFLTGLVTFPGRIRLIGQPRPAPYRLRSKNMWTRCLPRLVVQPYWLRAQSQTEPSWMVAVTGSHFRRG